MTPRGVRSFAWGASVVMVALYCAVTIPQKSQLRSLETRARTLYDAANKNEQLVAEEPRIRAARSAYRASILRLCGDPEDQAVAMLLDALDREASLSAVRIASIAPAGSFAQDPGFRRTQSLALTIGLEGSFASLLDMLRRLSEGQQLIRVDAVAMRSAPVAGSLTPALRADVQAHVYTLNAGWENDGAHAVAGAAR